MAALTIAALALALAPQESRLRPIPAPVRDAGVLHAASGTWTRRASAASIGADVVYDNTCSPLYYTAFSGDTFVDEGRLPSPTSPTSATSRPGCATQYTVDGFQIGFCDDGGGGPYEIAFFEDYAACTSAIGATPNASFPIAIPGCHASTYCCWTFTIDLDGAPGVPSQAFAMLADADGSYDGAESDNTFGWSIRSLAPAGSQLGTGPILAGVPTVCSHFDGTRWDSPVNYSELGTGMGTVDGMRVEGGPSSPGCLTFTNVYASLHLELYSDPCEGPFLSTFCHGDGSGTPCPCGNHSAPGDQVGCLNSLGVGGRLRATGVPSIGADTLVLRGDQMPPNAPTLYFQGHLQSSGGAGTVFGDGKRCASGLVARLGTVANSGVGASQYPRPGDPSVSVRGNVATPGIRTYQAWYRNAAAFCTSATFNLTNGIELVWTW